MINPLDNAHVAGRGIKQPYLDVTPGPRSVTVRIDDETNPAFWLELGFDLEALEYLTDAARGARQPR